MSRSRQRKISPQSEGMLRGLFQILCGDPETDQHFIWNKTVKTVATGGAILSMAALAACGGGESAQTNVSPSDNGATAATGPVTVTLSVMTSNRYLELAKQKFEESNPNVKIEIKETVAAPPQTTVQAGNGKQMTLKGGEKTDPKDAEKFVTTVNTELMSGKASDIIVTDGSFPYKKYADKKLLENIGDWMKKDSTFKRDDYYANVFDAMTYKNAIYALPTKLSLNWLIGNEAMLSGTKIDDAKWTWKDFQAAVEPFTQDANKDGVQDGYALVNTNAITLFNMMVNSSFGKLVDWSAKSFNAAAFTDMLKQSKAIADSNIVTSETLDRVNMLFQHFSPKQYEDMILQLQMMFDGGGKLYNLPTISDVRGLSFTSDMLLSLNAKSNYKKEAWEFIKFLLSEEMQQNRELLGFAVNKQASKARQEQLKEIGAPGSKMQMMISTKDGKQFKPKQPEQKEVDRIEQALSGIKYYAETDPKVMAIIEQEVGPYFSGQKSAEDVAKTVRNKVSTYLQE